jgi:hypothetical protein
VTLEGWIFMVGLRVFDVGGLIIWLVWFFKLRDTGPDEPDDGGEDYRYRWGRDPEEPQPPAGPPDLVLPKPDAEPWPSRRRDHGGDRAPATAPSRPYAPHRQPDRVPAERRERA